MIYVSTSGIKKQRISECIELLHSHGFRNIELSGGTEYYEGLEDDLLSLKKKHSLNYLCHNYFPPPKQHFTLNLASLDDVIYDRTISHFLSAIELAHRLESPFLGIHAGFFIDASPNELGKEIERKEINDKKRATERFCTGFNTLREAAGDLVLYVENNVISANNFKNFGGKDFFMLTSSSDYFRLKEELDFNLLLDIAHLKVSSHTLGLDFKNELSTLIDRTNYIHLSDNDGLQDQNNAVLPESKIATLLQKCGISEKTVTLEIYQGIKQTRLSASTIEQICHA